jgi:hypothetical protein
MPKKILDSALLQEIKNFRSSRHHIADIAHNINEGTNNNSVEFEIRFNEGSNCKVKVYPNKNRLSTDYCYTESDKDNAFNEDTVITESLDFIKIAKPYILNYYVQKTIITLI